MNGVHSSILSFEKLCRLCLQEKRVLASIYDSADDNDNLSVYEKIMACAKIALSRGDGLPSGICTSCLSSLNAAFEFRLQCENADKTLHDVYHLLMSDELQEEEKSKMAHEVEKTEDSQELAPDQLDSANSNKIIVIRRTDKSHCKEDNNCIKESEEEKEMVNLLYVMEAFKGNKEPKDNVIEMNTNVKGIDSNDFLDSLEIQIEEKESVSDNLNQLAFSGESSSPESPQGIKVFSKKNNVRSKDNPVPKKVPPDGKKSSCPFCQKMLIRVNEHIRLLHRNKVYICKKKECGAEFLTLKNLQSHQLRCYNMEKPYKCSRCSREFYRKCNYKAHARRHSNRKDFQCQLCEKAFVDSTGLRRHFLKHHEPHQEVYVVGCCGKKFKTKKGLKQHVEKGICGVQIFHAFDSENVIT